MESKAVVCPPLNSSFMYPHYLLIHRISFRKVCKIFEQLPFDTDSIYHIIATFKMGIVQPVRLSNRISCSGLMHVPESSYTKFMSTIETPREPSQWELNGTAGN